MSASTKITLYVVLTAFSVFFGVLFFEQYRVVMADDGPEETTDLEQVNLPGEATEPSPSKSNAAMTWFGLGFLLSVGGAGVMAAYDVSAFFGNRAAKAIYDDGGKLSPTQEYEAAEEEWAKGNHLESINLFREYLKNNPKAVHAMLRIAEIYEKDLNNPVAAALEYEELLTQPLPAKRWGWAAIHLCNLYFKIDKQDRATALLQRIVDEYPDTPAAEKARKHLGLPPGRTAAADDDEDEASF